MVHPKLAVPCAIGLLVVEIAIAVAHLLDRQMALFGPVTIAFLLAMIVVLIVVIRRGDPLECGCFGGLSDEQVSKRTVARASLLLAAECLVYAHAVSAERSVPFNHLYGAAVFESLLLACLVLLLMAWLGRMPELTGFVVRCISCKR